MKTQEEKRSDFAAMSAAERRVAIARDVILQVRTEQIIAHVGSYIVLQADASIHDDPSIDMITEMLEEKRAHCEVCGIGAGIVCAARLFNDSPAGIDEINNYLEFQRYFPIETRGKVEAAFEMRADYATSAGLDRTTAHNAAGWAVWNGEQYGPFERDDNARLLAIYYNIWRNGGEFLLDQAPLLPPYDFGKPS